VVGDIYLAKIFFTNLSESKIRPVLVIKQLGKDYVCLQLTSKLKNKKLILNNSDLTRGSLNKESLVVVPKNFTLHESVLFKYIATINKNKFTEIVKEFCKQLDCH